MLARHYFFKHEYEESIKYFDMALSVNKIQLETWFTKGCAHMKIEDWKGAAFAFGSVISIDDRKVEAWANLANCYVAQKRYFDAVNCTEQALKCNSRNWKVWNNYILFSM